MSPRWARAVPRASLLTHRVRRLERVPGERRTDCACVDKRDPLTEGKRKQALRSADVVCIVYDVTRAETFDSVGNRWMPELAASNVTVPVVLLGNKLDSRDPGDRASLAIRQRIVPLVQQYGVRTPTQPQYAWLTLPRTRSSGASNALQRQWSACRRRSRGRWSRCSTPAPRSSTSVRRYGRRRGRGRLLHGAC